MKGIRLWTAFLAIFALTLIGLVGSGGARTIQTTDLGIAKNKMNLSPDQIDYQIAFTNDSSQLSSIAFEVTADATCIDSDGGLNYSVAGNVSGVGANGWPYTKSDVCDSDNLKEYYCNGTTPWPKFYECPGKCQDGACVFDESCTDSDEDGYAIEGGDCGLVDCDDSDPNVNPGATEVCDNGIDDDCDGAIDALDTDCATGPFCTDSDGGLNYEVAGTVTGIGANGYPFSKSDVCDSDNLKEYYCNGTTPWPKFYVCDDGCADGACQPGTCTDSDEDGFAIEGGACGLVDCNDSDADVNPGATEVCDNGIDDDCDGAIDNDDLDCVTCTDADGDGYAVEGGACGSVDCNDDNAAIHPGAIENCSNGIDDNCNGLTDAQDPTCSGVPNIVVVGWDGTQRDHFFQCYNKELPECANGLPNIQALSGGTIFNNTITDGATSTKPGWAQIFTGYDADVTGVYDLWDYQPIPEGYTVFEKIEDHFGPENVVTMFISAKGVHTGGACIGDPTDKNGVPVIEDLGQPWCLTKEHLDYFEVDKTMVTDNAIGNRALELLDAHQDDLFFALFLFRTPDVIGHLNGEDSIQYSQAIINDDVWLGKIVAKLKDLGIYGNTLVYVVSDHGFDEGLSFHLNAPYDILATNDPQVVRSGDRKDIGPTFLERYGISLGSIGPAPAVNGSSLYHFPDLGCIPEGGAFLDYPGAPMCCSGLTLINLDMKNGGCRIATGGVGDDSGFCTACGNNVCESPENPCNCPADCPLY